MTTHFHAIVWIDHHLARVFDFDATDAHLTTIHSTRPTLHLHHKANSSDSGHAAVDNDYLERVARALNAAGAILITGPASAKVELRSYIGRKHPELGQRISAVQTLDHPTDEELVAHGRSFFKADDRMHSQLNRRA